MSDFRWHVYQEDCLAVLKRAPADYFDAMVTDPPGGISFMGREWDGDKGGRDHWIAWLRDVMKEAMRCLKPGAHALVWALPRTSHWTATALEDAGFEVRDCLTHHFGSGFPKSADLSKAMDALAGVEREVVRVEDRRSDYDGRERASAAINTNWRAAEGRSDIRDVATRVVTMPTTDEAKAWSGYGTALKPATEHWILCRKPLAESSIARNVLTHGVGGLNIDGCRVNRASDDVPGWHKTGAKGNAGYLESDTFKIRDMSPEEVQERCGNKGRWPTNLVLSHSADCRCVGADRVKANGNVSGQEPSAKTADVYGSFAEREAWVAHGNGDGTETVEVWECTADCPVAELDRQSGVTGSGTGPRAVTRKKTIGDTEAGWGMRHSEDAGMVYNDRGGASRFFPTFRYQAKPSRSEKEAGLDSLPTTTLNRVNPGGIEEPELSTWLEAVQLVANSILFVHQHSKKEKGESIVPEHVRTQAETCLDRAIPGGKVDDVSALMDMFISGTHQDSHFLNTVLSWNNILGDLCEQTKMFTTETKSNMTTELRILKSSLNQTTLDGIIKELLTEEPSNCAARVVIEGLNGLAHGSESANSISAVALAISKASEIKSRLRWAPVQVKNNHPTVKSVALMRWLCRLITPPGGLVLDPFCGSGSTGVACMKEGFRFIGIEQDAHYCEIAGARIAAAESKEEETDGRRTE